MQILIASKRRRLANYPRRVRRYQRCNKNP